MLAPFIYLAPRSLPEASDLLLAHGTGAKLLAGGTDLLPNLERRRVTVRAVVALPALPHLRAVAYQPGSGLRLGALATLSEVANSELVRRHCPLLSYTALQMATPGVRRLATLGGNLCGCLPAADMVVSLLAMDARVVIAGPAGERQAALDSFISPAGVLNMEPGEILVAVLVPRPSRSTAYRKLSVRAAADVALANAAVCLTLDGQHVREARLAFGAHGPRPARARMAEALLIGQAISADTAAAAAEAAADWACPADDLRASRDYRRAMISQMLQRAVLEAASAQ